jgi:hypothetical protein
MPDMCGDDTTGKLNINKKGDMWGSIHEVGTEGQRRLLYNI